MDEDVLHAYADGAKGQYQWLIDAMGADPKKLVQDAPWVIGGPMRAVPTNSFERRSAYVQN